MTYQRTTVDDLKDAADILIEYATGHSSGNSFTIKLQTKVDLGGKRGLIRTYRNGMVEVTAAKLEWLQARYKVQPNF